MDLRKRWEALEATEAEIRAESAASLGRVGRKVEACLVGLAALRDEIARGLAEACAESVAEHDRLVDEAREHLFHLIVQREAIGLRNHDDLAQRYPIPERIAARRRT